MMMLTLNWEKICQTRQRTPFASPFWIGQYLTLNTKTLHATRQQPRSGTTLAKKHATKRKTNPTAESPETSRHRRDALISKTTICVHRRLHSWVVPTRNFEIKTTFIMEQFHHNSDDKFALIILQETTQELDFNVVGIMNTRRIQKENDVMRLSFLSAQDQNKWTHALHDYQLTRTESSEQSHDPQWCFLLVNW